MELYKNYKIDALKCLEFIKNSLKKEYKKGFFQPPLDFYNCIDIKVFHYYDLNGMTIQDIQLFCYVKSNNYENLNSLLKDLIKINPCLKIFSNIKKDKIIAVIMGIASLINIDDIKYYIKEYYDQEQHFNRIMQKDYIQMESFLCQWLNIQNFTNTIYSKDILQWVLSPKTTAKIFKILKKRLKKN